MLGIVQQTIDFYVKNKQTPTLNDIEIQDIRLLERQACCFVTLYKNGEVRGSAGNIKELKKSVVSDLIENTITAAGSDKRFDPITVADSKDIKFRIDEIEKRRVIQNGEISKIDPVNSGIIAISRDYERVAVILPNIHPSLLTGSDYIPVLEKKLGEKKFDDTQYIIYEIQTKTDRNF